MWLTRLVIGICLATAVACGRSTSPMGGGGGGGGGTPGGSVVPVTIQDFTFYPATLMIKVGTSVQWTNNGPSQHTTTSDTGVWDSGTLSPPGGGGGYGGGSAGGTYTVTFSTVGTFSYHCAIHLPSQYPKFTGTITVTQ
jgi:plastocyanin